MYEAILAGLQAAKTDGVLRDSDANLERAAGYVKMSLGEMKSEVPPQPVVLPEATPVTLVGTADMVALIARSSRRLAPMGDPMTTEVVEMGAQWSSETYLAWALQQVFGVWSFCAPSGDTARQMKIAGYRSDVSVYRMVLDALLESGRMKCQTMNKEDRKVFWHTLGSLVTQSDKGKEQAKQAKDRCTEARRICEESWGQPQKVPTPNAAVNGSEVFEAAARTLAEATL